MGTAYIIEAVRSPLARVSKGRSALSDLRPDQLAARMLQAVLERSGVDPALVDDVVMGCVTQVGEQGLNVGRNAALVAGFPVSVTGTSVNRMCGSSQQALNFAAMGCASGFQELVIAGGVECMSRVPMGSDMFLNGEMVAPAPEMTWKYSIVPQGISAELVAQRYGLTRQDLDAFSAESHRRAAAAQDAGAFQKEIVAVGGVGADDGIRRGGTAADLGRLKPAFKEDGVITAASSSQITDGAAAVLVASEAAVKKYGLRPRAKIVAMATAGCDPTIMLTAPVPATQKALAQAGLTIGDIDAVEINEAFASVALGCGRHLGLDFEKTNINGGAIALGHPLGASGARLTATLLGILEARGGRFGLSTMCIGFGQGITTILDREV